MVCKTCSLAKMIYVVIVLASENPNYRQINVGSPTEQPEI